MLHPRYIGTPRCLPVCCSSQCCTPDTSAHRDALLVCCASCRTVVLVVQCSTVSPHAAVYVRMHVVTALVMLNQLQATSSPRTISCRGTHTTLSSRSESLHLLRQCTSLHSTLDTAAERCSGNAHCTVHLTHCCRAMLASSRFVPLEQAQKTPSGGLRSGAYPKPTLR